jgi:hypothetical protein
MSLVVDGCPFTVHGGTVGVQGRVFVLCSQKKLISFMFNAKPETLPSIVPASTPVFPQSQWLCKPLHSISFYLTVFSRHGP